MSSRYVTTQLIVQDFYEYCDFEPWEVEFVEYASNQCIVAYLNDDTAILYSYDWHSILEYYDKVNFMERYENCDRPLSMEAYKQSYAELVRGRMLAKRINRKTLSTLTGLDESYLYRIMLGQRLPSSYVTYILEFHLQNSKMTKWHLL